MFNMTEAKVINYANINKCTSNIFIFSSETWRTNTGFVSTIYALAPHTHNVFPILLDLGYVSKLLSLYCKSL